MLYNLNTKSNFYDKDSYNQCQNDLINLTYKYNFLYNENNALKEKYNSVCIENNTLKEEIIILNEKLDKLTNEVSVSTVEITKLKHEIIDLNRKLNINSSNSSIPPSKDKLTHKKIYNNREISDKKSGGQEGHKGSNLQFEIDPDKITESIDLKPHHCDQCNAQIEEFEHIDTRQVHDIKITKTITNYNIYKGVCTCGCEVTIDSKVKLPTHGVSYGDTFKSAIIYLHNKTIVPYEQLATLSNDIFDIKISEGTIFNFQNQIAQALSGDFIKTLKDEIISSELVMADETGMTVNKQTQWVHVACNDAYTLYTFHKNRGHKAMDEIGILCNIKGYLVTDAYSSYQKYAPNLVAHGLCNAHLLRELKSLEDYNITWPDMLISLLRNMNNNAKEDNYNEQIKQDLIKEYDNILTLANDELNNIIDNVKEHRKVNALIKRLTNKKDNYLAFLSHSKIPFTNNQSERDIRKIKVKDKISGGFRTEKGAENFLYVRSFIATMDKIGKNIIQSIRDILHDPGNYSFKCSK